MFCKALITAAVTAAAAMSIASVASAQYAPQQGQYPQHGGYGQQPSQYQPNTGGHGTANGGYNGDYTGGNAGMNRGSGEPYPGAYTTYTPTGPDDDDDRAATGGFNGGYDGGYNAGTSGGNNGLPNGNFGPGGPQNGYQPQSGYNPNQPNANQPNPSQPNVRSSIDMNSVRPGQSQLYRYMLPAGWRPIESPAACIVMSPDGSMAYGLMAPGNLQGNLSADAYMRDTLTRVAQFQDVQIMSGQKGQVRAPFTESGFFIVSYRYNNQPFMAMVNCAVAQNANGTYGFLQVLFGTQPALQANSQPLMQLLSSITPLNPAPNGPTTNGPTTNGPVNNGPANNGPMNGGGMSNGGNGYNPNAQPTSFPGQSNQPTSVNPLER